MTEHTIAVVSSCGHIGSVEAVAGTEERLQTGIATMPCHACRCAADAVQLWERGDKVGAQVVLHQWLDAILATDDDRAKRLMVLVKQLD